VSESANTANDVEYYPFPTKNTLPFSAAVRVGNVLYVSGQMGTDESLKIVSGGIEAETRQTLANMKAILERHGSSLDRVVKCQVMMADMSEWPAMNAVYVQHFTKHLPARSAFGAAALALGGRVEIECMATVDEPARNSQTQD
jgi:2-iminobutanoate/2-iminopropanoate deaminase